MTIERFCRRFVSLSLLCAMASFGCSGGANRATVIKVKGKVTLGGAPIAGANVIFSPKGTQPVAMGKSNDAGEYTLTTYSPGDGAAAGDYIVLVSKEAPAAAPDIAHGVGVANRPAAAHESKKAGGSGASSSTGLLPEKYGSAKTSTLTATVKDAATPIDLELKP